MRFDILYLEDSNGKRVRDIRCERKMSIWDAYSKFKSSTAIMTLSGSRVLLSFLVFSSFSNSECGFKDHVQKALQ